MDRAPGSKQNPESLAAQEAEGGMGARLRERLRLTPHTIMRSYLLKSWIKVTISILAVEWGWGQFPIQAAETQLAIDARQVPYLLVWTSDSLTTNPPYLHCEFQLEASSDLVTWTNWGAARSGGVLTARSMAQQAPVQPGETMKFYRLSSRLNMPGADLSGLDLGNIDLRGANLAGANLSNANLKGANLAGADLSGAILQGAQLSSADLRGALLAGVSLDGLDLAGVDLSQIQGMPRLGRVNADPLAEASEQLPAIPYHPEAGDFILNEPGLPDDVISPKNMLVMLKERATVGQLNDLLAQYGASIIASARKERSLSNALLMIQLPSGTLATLTNTVAALQSEPPVQAAGPDVRLATATITYDAMAAGGAVLGGVCPGTAPPTGSWDWRWDAPGAPHGGNWGLEWTRIPQMWNWSTAIQKQGTGKITTAVIDGGFVSHPDVAFAQILGTTNLWGPDHGLHVSGTIGATYGNTNGLDGVNPFASLVGYTTHVHGFGLAESLAHLFYSVPDVKVVNLSMEVKAPLPVPIPLLPLLEVAMLAQGAAFGAVAITRPSVLIVCAAGNHSGQIPIRVASPACNASLVYGANNILIVESHGMTGARSSFSNSGGDVQAPGEFILSAVTGGGYASWCGTSMATPLVTGLAGYLLALDPTLTVAELKSLLGSNSSQVDAFASIMNVDLLPGRSHKALKLLLDISDGDQDGNLRVPTPEPRLVKDRSFEPILGADFTDEDVDGDGGPGDGIINMADFRRWRDWLLAGEGNNKLNGSSTNLKSDANLDGRVDGRETTLYPRGDFNGDGLMDRSSRKAMAGALNGKQLTDLEVLMQSGLWQDDDFTRPGTLTNLIDSVDFTVFATNFFHKNGWVPKRGELAVYSSETGFTIPEYSFDRYSISETNPTRILTVPTGGKYYVASDYISLGGGTNVMMRSIGEIEVDDSARGADYAVDLTLVEMTAVAELQNPDERDVQSKPDESTVDAHFGPAAPELPETAGVSAWASKHGTFYALARAGVIPGYEPTDEKSNTVYSASVRWQRSFTKIPGEPPPVFEVKPMILRLAGSGPQGEEQTAYAEIFVDVRAYDRSVAWQPVFSWRAEIAGAGGGGVTPSFRIVGEEGTPMGLKPKPLKPLGDSGVEYIQDKFVGTIPLGGIPDGNTFEVRYTLLARVVSFWGGDRVAEAYIGDPLDYGMRMAYGSFGELPRITSFALDAAGAGHIGYQSHSNFYYILYEAAANEPVAVKLGVEGLDEMIDPTPPNGAGLDSYRLENQPLATPLDLDEDGIDDVYELRHAAILHPLDPTDALQDPDNDSRHNLREYLDGTDPQVADAAPGQPSGLYPALQIQTGLNPGAIGDVNNDGRVDLVGIGGSPAALQVSLVESDGRFLPPKSSPLPESGMEHHFILVDVNGDADLDALIVHPFENILQVMIGDGQGTFLAGQQYEVGRSPERVATGDVNGDGRLDAVTVNRLDRSLSILLGNGDGTFSPAAPLMVSFQPADAVLAKLDHDAYPELLVTLSGPNQLLVFEGTGSPSFGQVYTNQTGFSPQRVIAGDVNRDTQVDVIVSTQSGDGVSVLLGNGDRTLRPKVDYVTGDNPREVALADLDGDLDLDLVVAHLGADYQAVLLNDGSGAFTPKTPAFTTSGGQVFMADFNGDTMLDLLANGDEGKIFLSPGLPGAAFDTRWQYIIPLINLSAYDVGDLNSDGFPDVVAADGNLRTNTLEVLLNAGGTNLTRSSSFIIGPQVQAIKLGRFDTGTTLDLAVLSKYESFSRANPTNQLQIFLGNGAGGFTAQTPIPLSEVPSDLLAGDVNGDGQTDLVVSFFLTSSMTVFLNQGSGLFAPTPALALGGFASQFRLHDLNGDGRADLVAILSQGRSNTVQVYFADANGAFSPAQEITPSNLGSFGFLALHDLNQDGRLDLAATIAGGGSSRLVFYPDGGNGVFGQETLLMEGNLSAFEIADLNGDDRDDVFSAGQIWLARSDSGYETPQSYWIRTFLAPRLVDMNSDGKLDIIAADDLSDSIQVLFHR